MNDTYLESRVDLVLGHVGASEMQDDLHTHTHNLLCKLETPLGCGTASAPCHGDCKGGLEGWRSESADTVEEVHETGVCEWWEELVIVEWAIVRGYEGCEMGHFVGGEYIDPLRNTNVECDSKLNNPELAYIALIYSAYTSEIIIKASLGWVNYY